MDLVTFDGDLDLFLLAFPELLDPVLAAAAAHVEAGKDGFAGLGRSGRSIFVFPSLGLGHLGGLLGGKGLVLLAQHGERQIPLLAVRHLHDDLVTR